MRGSEVKIGGSYLARVSGVLCVVEVVRELFARRGTRWACMNTRTGRMIEVSAARLRYLPHERPERPKVERAPTQKVGTCLGGFRADLDDTF